MIERTTCNVDRRITVTSPVVKLATNAYVPFGVIAMPRGSTPTLIGAPTTAGVAAARSITDTEPSMVLVTSARLLSGVMAT